MKLEREDPLMLEFFERYHGLIHEIKDFLVGTARQWFHRAQFDSQGRPLTPPEVVQALKDFKVELEAKALGIAYQMQGEFDQSSLPWFDQRGQSGVVPKEQRDVGLEEVTNARQTSTVTPFGTPFEAGPVHIVFKDRQIGQRPLTQPQSRNSTSMIVMKRNASGFWTGKIFYDFIKTVVVPFARRLRRKLCIPADNL